MNRQVLLFSSLLVASTAFGSTLSFNASVTVNVTEFLNNGDVVGDTCDKAASGGFVDIMCEYKSGQAFVGGSGDPNHVSMNIVLFPFRSYSDENGDDVWVDFYAVGDITADLSGLYYISGGRGTAMFGIPEFRGGNYDWDLRCSMFVDGVEVGPYQCGGSFEATFGKPFHLRLLLHQYLPTAYWDETAGLDLDISTVYGPGGRYELHAVPEPATIGQVVSAALFLLGLSRVRRHSTKQN